jgi:hypothetical protein
MIKWLALYVKASPVLPFLNRKVFQMEIKSIGALQVEPFVLQQERHFTPGVYLYDLAR